MESYVHTFSGLDKPSETQGIPGKTYISPLKRSKFQLHSVTFINS